MNVGNIVGYKYNIVGYKYWIIINIKWKEIHTKASNVSPSGNGYRKHALHGEVC